MRGVVFFVGGITLKAMEEQVKKALAETRRRVARREQATADMGRALAKQGYAPEVVAEVLRQATDEGTLDDGRYARAQVRHWVLTTTQGPRLMAAKLHAKGVNRGVVDQALVEEYPHELQLAVARKLAERGGGLPRHKRQARLVRRGFGYEVVGEVLGEGDLG